MAEMPDRVRSEEATNPDLIKQTERAIWRCSATAAGTADAWLLLGVLVIRPLNLGTSGLPLLAKVIGAIVPYFAFAAAFGVFTGRRQIRAALAWLSEGRAPNDDDRTRLAALPRRRANHDLMYWIGAALWAFPFVTVALEGAALPIATAIGGYWIAALLSWVLCYFLVDRALRPVRALASDRTSTPPSNRMNVFGRLILAWVASSAVPLAAIAIVVLGAQRIPASRIATLVWGACAASALAGLILTGMVARTVSEPLEKLRIALRGVELGVLDKQLAVDESGELGALQAGYNRMTDGLVERERMRDVFGRHVGPDVARFALERDFAAGGETCEATAMFVDLVGSTALAQRESPDAVVAILNQFFDAVVRVVGAEGGFVNKFQGDGALCLFGTPTPQRDHAARGLRAARALSRELTSLANVTAAIGVSTGSVVAGYVGTTDRHEFTVIGDPVNEAARLTDEAKLHPSHVLASDRTVRAAGDAARGWIRGEAIALRGRSQPTITYSPYD